MCVGCGGLVFPTSMKLSKHYWLRRVVNTAGVVFFLGLVCGMKAEESRQGVSSGSDIRGDMEARKAQVDAFKQRLETAKTAEEKRAMVAEWREQREAQMKQLSHEKLATETPAQMVEKMERAAEGNPEMQKRVEQMKARLAEIESIKAKLEKIKVAQGEEKQALLVALRQERESQLAARKIEMESMRAGEVEESKLVVLPPEMQARVEKRRVGMERLQKMLKEGSVAQKQQAVEEFRAQQNREREEFQRSRSQKILPEEAAGREQRP